MTPEEFVRLPPREAIRWMRERGISPPEIYKTLPAEYRQFAFSISGVAALDQLQAVLDSLEQALASGETFGTWRKRVQAEEIGLALPRHRLDNIFRTNMQGAYMRGAYERQHETRATRPYLMYDAINDSRTRPNHRALDNFIAPADAAIWATHRPPLGYRCRCSLITLTERQARDRGYQGLPAPNVQPDEGWDYDKTAGIGEGVRRSVQRALQSAHPKLAAAMSADITR